MALCTNWGFSDQPDPEVANVVDREVEYAPLHGSLLEYTDNQPYARQNRYLQGGVADPSPWY